MSSSSLNSSPQLPASAVRLLLFHAVVLAPDHSCAFYSAQNARLDGRRGIGNDSRMVEGDNMGSRSRRFLNPADCLRWMSSQLTIPNCRAAELMVTAEPAPVFEWESYQDVCICEWAVGGCCVESTAKEKNKTVAGYSLAHCEGRGIRKLS